MQIFRQVTGAQIEKYYYTWIGRRSLVLNRAMQTDADQHFLEKKRQEALFSGGHGVGYYSQVF